MEVSCLVRGTASSTGGARELAPADPGRPRESSALASSGPKSIPSWDQGTFLGISPLVQKVLGPLDLRSKGGFLLAEVSMKSLKSELGFITAAFPWSLSTGKSGVS